jgi:deazaflavin-dependent oxidoreductase (nitroreductase family)
MLTQLIAIAGVAIVGSIALGVIFLLGMRTKSPLVQGPVIWISKRWVNPRQLRTAGRPGAYAAIIRTVGRTSGRRYETPVGAFAIDGGFLISLPYGTRPQWLKNVLAAGGATLVHEGRTWAVDRPELAATADVAALFPEAERRTQQRFKVDSALRLRAVPAADATDKHVAADARAATDRETLAAA